jgi:hypothetical protein
LHPSLLQLQGRSSIEGERFADCYRLLDVWIVRGGGNGVKPNALFRAALHDCAEPLLQHSPALSQELFQCARALGRPSKRLEAVIIHAFELFDRPLV